MNYQLSRLAEKDLEDIWEYTFKNWSLKQADKYIKQIFKQVEKTCSSPEIGRPIYSIKPQHRMVKVNSHLIIYKIENKILKMTGSFMNKWTSKIKFENPHYNNIIS